MLPTSIPIFPLPSIVLFPNVFLPLHIFEPRYRQMVADALENDRMIGMVLFKPGWQDHYEGQPAIYQTGCSGLISHVEKTEDGRYNIILRGLEKFTVHSEDAPTAERLYRTALVTPIDETPSLPDREALTLERRRLEAIIPPLFQGTSVEHRLPTAMPDEDLVNALAQYLEFDPIEKLALLECHGTLARCRAMTELVEMKSLLKKMHGDAGMIH